MIQDALDLGIPIPEPKVTKAPSTKVTWSRYRPQKPVHCDRCLRNVHLAWPVGTHAPNRAVYRRKEAGETTFWCWVHAEEQHQVDGLPKPKKR